MIIYLTPDAGKSVFEFAGTDFDRLLGQGYRPATEDEVLAWWRATRQLSVAPSFPVPQDETPPSPLPEVAEEATAVPDEGTPGA